MLLRDKYQHPPQPSNELQEISSDKIGVWLVSTPRTDLTDRLWSINEPVAESDFEQELIDLLRLDPSLPLIHDVMFENPDQEYIESIAVNDILRQCR